MAGGTLMVLVLSTLSLLVYAFRLNWVLGHTPKEAAEYAGEPLAVEEIRRIFEKVEKQRVIWETDLPPRRDRRYVVVGGSGEPTQISDANQFGVKDLESGFVGGQIILDLLARGTPPEAIRILDARRPVREEFSHGAAAKVDFVQVDVTSEAATLKAFNAPWPESVSGFPLTVFHTAAVIRPFERFEMFYDRSSRVNVGGAANSLAGARKVGANVFIFTSSSTAALSEVRWFFAPWGRRQQPLGFVQFLSEKDFFEPMKEPREFPCTYSRSKAEAERLVCGADEKGVMRTGAIRPGNAVYGHRDDNVLGKFLELKRVPALGAQNVQNFCHVRNVSLAHLRYEDALLGGHVDRVAGRPYMVTDGGPPIRFDDMFNILSAVSSTGFRVDYPPPLLLLLLSFVVEAYCVLLVKVPFLRRVMGELQEPLRLFQPGVFAVGVSCILDDSDAKKKPEDGGIGYTPCCTTVEGMCEQIVDWNEWVKRRD